MRGGVQLRDQDANNEANAAIWSASLASEDWLDVANKWSNNVVNEQTVLQVAISSAVVRLCHSEVSRKAPRLPLPFSHSSQGVPGTVTS
jgi:hypothetical protein